jgi:hypothetical protein
LIALLLLGSSSALFAQNITDSSGSTNSNTTTTNDMNTTNDQNVNSNSTNNSNNSNTSTNMNNMNTADSNTTNTAVSTGSYPAYGTVAVDVPTTVRYSFQKEYPNVTNAQWYLTPNGQYRVIYKDNSNQDVDVYYYGTSAQSYMVSLPIRQSLTPDDIVTKARSMYGMSVYDINRVRAADSQYVYHLRLLDNGQVKDVWLNEQGNEVVQANVFRTHDVNNDIINEVNTTTSSESGGAMNNSAGSGNNTNSTNTNNSVNDNSNNNSTTTDNTTTNDSGTNETKIKMKSSDGTKIKSKDGELKVK